MSQSAALWQSEVDKALETYSEALCGSVEGTITDTRERCLAKLMCLGFYRDEAMEQMLAVSE